MPVSSLASRGKRGTRLSHRLHRLPLLLPAQSRMYSCPRWVGGLQSHLKSFHEAPQLDPASRQGSRGKPNETQSMYCNQSETHSWVTGLVVPLRLILDDHR